MPPKKLKLLASEKAKLVAFYKDAMRDVMNSIDRHVWSNPKNPRLVALLSESKKILSDLDKKAAAWADTEVKRLYGANVAFIDDQLKNIPVNWKHVDVASRTAKIHTDAINNLILNPTTGITPRLLEASSSMGKSIQSFVHSNKTLLAQQTMLADQVAKNIFTGTATKEARNAVLKSMLQQGGLPPKGFMSLNPLTASAKSLIDAPYLVKSNGARMHIFDHVQMTATTMESKVRTDARNARMIQNEIRLAQITPNPPLTECVCSLYAGRIFALDPESEKLSGHPYIGRIPNGGPPFHPYCTHTTLPWVEEFIDEESKAYAVSSADSTKTFKGNGVPVAALTNDFSKAQKYFKKRGGMSFAAKQNPQLSKFRPHPMSSKEVQGAFGKTVKPPTKKAVSKVKEKPVKKPTTPPPVAEKAIIDPPKMVTPTAPVPTPPKPKPVPKPVTAAQIPPTEVIPDGSVKVPGFGVGKRVQSLGGSNGAELWEFKVGDVKTRLVVKGAKSAEHLAEEMAAHRLYNKVGAKTPFHLDVSEAFGKPTLAVEFKENMKSLDDAITNPDKLKDLQKQLREDFAADAWLANWDVIGLEMDNVLVSSSGKILRIDHGGALRFRAQGQPKPSFGTNVTEIETLRNPSVAPQASSIFGEMTDQDIIASIDKLLTNTKDGVWKTALKSVNPDKADDLILILDGRLKSLKAYQESLKRKYSAKIAEGGTFKTTEEAAQYFSMNNRLGLTAEDFRRTIRAYTGEGYVHQRALILRKYDKPFGYEYSYQSVFENKLATKVKENLGLSFDWYAIKSNVGKKLYNDQWSSKVTLRNMMDESPEVKRFVEAMTNTFDEIGQTISKAASGKSELSRIVHVSDEHFDRLAKRLSGGDKEIRMNGITSFTTKSSGVDVGSGEDRPVIYRVKKAEGIGLDLQDDIKWTVHPGESEVLVGQGQQFRVVSVEYDDYQGERALVVHMEPVETKDLGSSLWWESDFFKIRPSER